MSGQFSDGNSGQVWLPSTTRSDMGMTPSVGHTPANFCTASDEQNRRWPAVKLVNLSDGVVFSCEGPFVVQSGFAIILKHLGRI